MKKPLITTLAIIIANTSLQAQTDTTTTQTTIDTSLCSKSKIELSQLYIKEVQRVNGKLYVLPLLEVKDNVPTSKYTNKKFVAVQKKCDSFNNVLSTHFYEMLPYADKQQLINAILYLQKQ